MADSQLERRDSPYVMEDYDPNKMYRFVDKDGNVFYSKGDNGYVQQSMTQGIPISVNSNGDWYTEPYLESNGKELIAHIPNWFKSTSEYSDWSKAFEQMPSSGLNKEYLSKANKYLKSLGSQGALRWTLKNDIATYGVTDKALQDKYFDWMLSMGLEGKEGGEKAKIKGLFGDSRERSVEDIVRDYKNMSKEDLSRVMTNLYKTAAMGKNGSFDGSEEDMLSTVATIKMLNWVDDNYKNYGKDEEFKELLEASFWQKFNAANKSFLQTMAEGFPIANLATRAIYGLGEVMKGNDFSMRIEDAREELLNAPDAGGALENSDAFNGIGNVMGSVGNIAGTMTLSVALGNFISGKEALASPGSFMSKLGDFAKTIPGAAATDFFLNDVPVDLAFFATDWARTGDPGKAWLNVEETQPLFGIPVIGNFGPQVYGGLATNLLGDVIIDSALPILSVVGNTSFKKLDVWTAGGVTRVREKAAITNLKIQEKLTNIPVVGKAWKAFINHMMGAENASFIREARKEAIIEGSMEPYIKAQNNLTSYNHKGMDVIHPMYKKLDGSLNISKDLKQFSKRAKELGGVGEVNVKWNEARRGVKKTFEKVVPDTMPRDVKRVLLDTERLSELKGEVMNEGAAGMFSNPARRQEIAMLEERLSKAPAELKEFAQRYSDLNKGVEQIRVELGLTKQEWLDALNADPRWNAYMTRQQLVPGNTYAPTAGGSVDPSNPAILNKSRTGSYDPDKYIDPMLALSLKVEALGQAYAWNERSKLLVAFEIGQGKLVAGKGGVEVAQRLAEIKADIKAKSALREAIDYDVTVKSFGDDMATIGNAFTEVNDLLHLPEQLNLKAIYDVQQSPRIKSMVNDFETGKIQFADGVKESVKLSDSDAAAVIRNTYAYNGMETKALYSKKIGGQTASSQEEFDLIFSRKYGDALGFKTFDELKNDNGEVDAGIFGLTEKQQKEYEEWAKKTDIEDREKLRLKFDKELEEWKKSYAEWSKEMSDYGSTRTAKEIENDPFGAKLYKKFSKEHPAPKRPQIPDYGSVGNITSDYLRRRLVFDNISEDMVDSAVPANVKFAPFNKATKQTWKDDDNFNYLTRGENRRALYQKGYDNLDAKTKRLVDRADNMFTQRLAHDVVLYRGETASALKARKLKVGDELDSSAWTYTQFLPEQTELYRHGVTTNYWDAWMNTSEGVLYRFHMKEGSPVFHKPFDMGRKNGTHTEFVLPRDIKARVTNIEKGFVEPGSTKNAKTVGLPIFRRATIVDVEVDPNSGFTPAMKSQTRVSAEGGTEFLTLDSEAPKSGKARTLDYNAGMTPDGRAFKYEIRDGKVTSMEEITDSDGMSVALSHIGGSFTVTPETIDRIGMPMAQALGRTITFYKDNMPDIGINSQFMVTYDYGNWGFVPWPNQNGEANPWNLAVDKNGKLTMGDMPVYVCEPAYSKGHEAEALRRKRDDVASGRKPKNTATLESTPTHENGHATVNKLGLLELNRKIDAGEIPKLESWKQGSLLLAKEIDDIQDMMVKNALAKLGVEDTPANRQRYGATISEYASIPVRRMSDPYGPNSAPSEIFSEAMRMYQGNGEDSSPFCLAIVEEMKKLSEQHSHVAAPGDVFVKNGLTPPKGLFKNDQYAFPTSARSAKARGEWLDEWRQKNPYLSKKFDEETYQKANLWDTYFKREVYSFDAKAKSSMPDKLAKKNGQFLEELSSTAAKRMVQKIREASIKGFSEQLATMALSRNSKDIADAMDSFIVGRVNKAAREIAKKMPGGLTDENLLRARATMWSEDILRNEVTTMLSKLVPDIDNANIVSKIDDLFDTQAKGFAANDALPLETKQLIGEKEKLQAQLQKENSYALKKGREVDSDLYEKGYINDETQVIHYKEAGEDVYVVVNDPVVASMLKRPTEYKSTGVAVEALAQASNFIARSYRIGTTAISPLAFVRNVLRDPFQATIQGGFNPLNMNLSPDVFYHTLRNYGLDDATINEVTTRIRNWASSSTLTAEMRDMGIGTNMPGYKNKVEKASKDINKIFDHKILEVAEAPLETWESMFRNQIAQQSFIKNYDRTGDVNKAMASAMFDASNSTTNFSHAVGLFKRATGTVPYLSSAINGVRSFWVQFNVDPIGMITRCVAGGMVPMMAITAWNLSSEERKKAYMNLPEWYRDRHLVLLDLDNNVISFPIPDELMQFFGTARRLIEYTADVNKQGIPMILAQGAFGFLPGDWDGFFKEDGSIDLQRGLEQLLSGLMPQAVTAVYEFVAQRDTYLGTDISYYNWYNRWINLASNTFGAFVKNIFNDIGMICGAPEDLFVGKSTADTLARDLFGMGFDEATNQFMSMIGDKAEPAELDPTTGKVIKPEKKATGLYAENERVRAQIAKFDKDIASAATPEEKKELEEKKAKYIEDFQKRVAGLVNNYMNLYTQTGGLKDWQKSKIVDILILGESSSSADANSYQGQDSSQAYLDERALAQGRYVDAGLPAGATEETILNQQDSIAVQAALNRFYGVTKQATADFKTALKESGLKDIRDNFFDAVEQIYDIAEESGTEPDYDMITRIQARYLQAIDGILTPIINQYGLSVLNNNDFIDEVRRYVNGMVPSDDWRQSIRNKKKFLSKKDYPLAAVDTKKWLIDRYSSGMRDRGLDSDDVVKTKMNDIKATIDRGDKGAAKSKISDLFNGIKSASFYISPNDMTTLYNWNSMLK